MSRNADRSLTYRIQLSSNRTKQWYKLQLEEEKRQREDNVQRTILADQSEELPLYERMGGLTVYRDGVLYLQSPALGETMETPEVPQSIWWSVNFSTGTAGLQNISLNRAILSTNETNNDYIVRYFTFGSTNTKLYNRDGTLVKNMSPSWISYLAQTIISFIRKDGTTIKTYNFRNLNNRMDYLNTINFTNASIMPRIATTSNRVYSVLPVGYLNTALVSPPPNGPKLEILDDSNSVIANITTDVSGGNANRFDSALLIYSAAGDYITNVSMRTRDLSDNNANSIAIRGLNTFSDGSVILCGDFNTQQIVFFNAADVSMGQLTLPIRKTAGTNNNRDIFMAAFDTGGALRYYNYIRSTNQNVGQNEIDTAITIDTADNVYIIGSYINSFIPPAGTSLMQFFAKNKSSTSLSSNILYDTSGYTFNGDLNNTCNFSTANLFITKYNYNGDFQWFTPMGTNTTDLSGDVSYDIKTTSNGIILSILYAGTPGSPSGTLLLYQGKTSAQRDTSGVVFRSVPLSNTSLYNNVIMKYNFDGTGSWVKSISGDIHFGNQTANVHPIKIVVDSSNNIYNICSLQGSVQFPNARVLNIGVGSSVTPLGATFFPSSGSNPFITSFDNSGNLLWNGIINTTGPGGSTYCYNALSTSTNSLILLCNSFSNTTFSIYNSSSSLISSQAITLTNTGSPYLLIYKVLSNGSSLEYILSDSTTALNIRVNNGISIDSNDNIYVTGELFSSAPSIGQTMNLRNQSGNIVATITKRDTTTYEYFTVKIPASFTQE